MVTLNPKLCNTAKHLYKPPLKFLLFWAKFKESDSNFQLSMFDKIRIPIHQNRCQIFSYKNISGTHMLLKHKGYKGADVVRNNMLWLAQKLCKTMARCPATPCIEQETQAKRSTTNTAKSPQTVSQYEDRLWHLNGSPLVPRSLKCSKKISSHTITPSEALIQDRKCTCFHVV